MSRYSHDKGYQAYRILQFTFIIAPILAGLDKFFYLLANWSQYLAPHAMQLLQNHHKTFMMIVGVIEVIAGLGVIFKPKIFAYIISVWLLLIVINLLLTGRYFDIALRDIGLMLAAFALGKLGQKYEEPINQND